MHGLTEAETRELWDLQQRLQRGAASDDDRARFNELQEKLIAAAKKRTPAENWAEAQRAGAVVERHYGRDRIGEEASRLRRKAVALGRTPCRPSGGTRRLAPGRPRAGRRVATRGSPSSSDDGPEPAEPLTPLQTALHYVAAAFVVVRGDGRALDALLGVLGARVAREYAKTLDEGERP